MQVCRAAPPVLMMKIGGPASACLSTRLARASPPGDAREFAARTAKSKFKARTQKLKPRVWPAVSVEAIEQVAEVCRSSGCGTHVLLARSVAEFKPLPRRYEMVPFVSRSADEVVMPSRLNESPS